MINAFLVLLGGGIGALSRYGVSLLAARIFGASFPVGTLTVNLLGCFLIGLVLSLSERLVAITPALRLLIVTGFLGGLTTFSSFAFETVNAFRPGTQAISIVNFFSNNVAGLGLVALGMWLGRPS